MPKRANSINATEIDWRWVFPIVVLVLFVGDRILRGKNGEVHHQQLEREFRLIAAPPTSKLIANLNFFSVWNPGKASVGASYANPQSHADIRNFYDRELGSMGWRRSGTVSLSEDAYSKGEFRARLRFEGNLPTGADYVLSLDW